MEMFLNLLNAIFYIAERHGEELTFNADTNKIYKVMDKSSGVFTLLPLDGSAAPTSIFSEASLIFRNDIAGRSAKLGRITAKIGITTSEQRNDNSDETESASDDERIENGSTTALQRTNNGSGTDTQRHTIGAGTVSLPRISQLYTGELAGILAEIEAALDRVFLQTNKEATIKKYIEKYNNVKRLAQSGQLYELKLVLKSLQGTIEKQKAMQKGAAKFEFKQTLKKRLINTLIIMVFVAVALLWFRPWKHTTTTVSSAPTPPAEMSGVTLSTFDKAIADFERSTGKKIYPAGRECLQRTAAKLGLTTQKELMELIKQNVK